MTPTTQDKKMNIMLWIVGIAFGAMLGVGGTVTLAYGSTRNQVNINTTEIATHTEEIKTIRRTTVDYVYIQDLITSNYMMIDIMKATPGTKEMEEALKAWKDFQMNTMRRANPTRGGSASSSNGAKSK